MWLILIIYWIVAGFAVVIVGPNTKDLRVEALAFLLGGFIVPARIVAKLIA